MLDVTLIVPTGPFTIDLARRVRETSSRRAEVGDVIISMKSTKHFSWNGLQELADALRSLVAPHSVHLSDVLPATRALLRELGVDGSWFVEPGARRVGRILVV